MNLPKLSWSHAERADLHVHSHYSDGQHSPRQIAQLAAQKGLHIIALTDHASIAGIAEMTGEAAKRGIYNIPGIELNAATGDFLGYFLDYENKKLLAFLDEVNHFRKARIKESIVRLNELGYDIDWSSLVSFALPAIPSRTHIARMFVNQGRYRNVDAVFKELLRRGRSAYIAPKAPSDIQCMQMIREAGGIAVLAHPHYLDIPKNEIRKYGQDLASWSLSGYERIPKGERWSECKSAWERIEKETNLIKFGGSGFHGDEVSGVALGARTIPGFLIPKMERHLPAETIHKDFFKRLLWRSINLNSEEFKQSLFPEVITLKEQACSRLLSFIPNVEPVPADFLGTPYVLLGPGAFNQHKVIIEILENFGAQIVAVKARDDYPELAWTIYQMDKLSLEDKKRDALRFELDNFLYGSAATKYRIIFFHNKAGVALRRLKKHIRRTLGQMRFYRVVLENLSDTFFTSYVHIPSESDINREGWILDRFGLSIKSE